MYMQTTCRKPKPGRSLAEVRPDIAIDFAADLNDMSPYDVGVGSSLPVWWRCNKCGKEWRRPVFKRVSDGSGCPDCVNARRRKPHDQFVREVEERNGKVDVIGTYVNQRTKVKLRCRECGHEWYAYPTNTLQGQACPICARQRMYGR